MKNEFDWHIQINKMQNLNDMLLAVCTETL